MMRSFTAILEGTKLTAKVFGEHMSSKFVALAESVNMISRALELFMFRDE
jgi:hypothetical protein